MTAPPKESRAVDDEIDHDGPAGPNRQPGQRQIGVLPGGNHQVQLGWQVLH